jgi:hypothetical protein
VQNRYAGDVGDYVKYALLRTLTPGRRLGVAWYLYPDEGHNADGKHISYLDQPAKWRDLDPELFDALKRIVDTERSVARVESDGILCAEFHSDVIRTSEFAAAERAQRRSKWFETVQTQLAGCDLVFADPDNGVIDDNPARRKQRMFGKQMPLSEVRELAAGRAAVIYHHNTRFPGGHDLEVDRWLGEFGNAVAIRANAYNCRTFFILNPDDELRDRASKFAVTWRSHKVRLHSLT